MKTLLTTLVLTLTTGCMADWTDIPQGQVSADASNGQDAASADAAKGDTAGSQDSKGDTAGQDIAADTTSTDAAVQPSCGMPTKDRLVQNTTYDGNVSWHDKLLDIDCVFWPTVGFGKRCLPLHIDKYATWGNPNFPASYNMFRYLSENCTTNEVFAAKMNDSEQWPRFGFHLEGTTSTAPVTGAFNLAEPPTASVVHYSDLTGKADQVTGAYTFKSFDCVAYTQPVGFGAIGPDGKTGWALMVATGTAAIPECPYLTGLTLFAPMP